LFKEVAPKYHIATKALSFGRDRAWKKMLLSMLPSIPSAQSAQSSQSGDKLNCLDIACGTGDITFELAEKYPQSKVLGIDLSEDMISYMKDKGRKINIRFITSDMNSTGLPDKSFDIVTGGYALRNSPDLEKTLKEIYRILKKGGRAAFLDFSKSPNMLIRAISLTLLKFWGNIWGIILHGNPQVYGYIAESLKFYPDRKKFRTMLEENGFENIKSKILFFGFVQILVFSKQ
jgi:demethylmenaquinone methyltransferase/2-methoxy-6-polyprenyl-1,4-benzoquinol methylase